MASKCVKVIKADQIEIAGSLPVGLTADAAAGPAAQCSPAAEGLPQVRVIETCDTYAILEFVCSCGSKNRVRCNYGTA